MPAAQMHQPGGGRLTCMAQLHAAHAVGGSSGKAVSIEIWTFVLLLIAVQWDSR